MSKEEEKKEEVVELVKLDLGCGDNKREGFKGVDLHKTDSVDIEADLFGPWPFEDSSVDEIHCSHFIEHTPDLLHFWKELYRVLKPEGKATIIAPFGRSNRAWQDPTHTRAIVEETFFYLDRNFRKANKLEHYLPDIHFEYVVVYLGIDAMWMNRSEEARSFAIKHYWNVVSDIQGTLTKKA